MYTSGPVTASLGNSEEKEATEAREPSTAQGRVENEGEDPYAVGGVCPWWRGRGLSLEQPGAPDMCFSGGVLSLQPPIPGSLWTLHQARLSLPNSVLSPQASPGCVTSV